MKIYRKQSGGEETKLNITAKLTSRITILAVTRQFNYTGEKDGGRL